MHKIFFPLLLLLAIITPARATIEDHLPLLTFSVICLVKACQEVAQEHKAKNKLKQQELKQTTAGQNATDMQKVRELMGIIRALENNSYLLEICAKKPALAEQCNAIFHVNIQTYAQASEMLRHKLKQLQDNDFTQEDLAILRELKDTGYRGAPGVAHAVVRAGSVPAEAVYKISNERAKQLLNSLK